MWLAVIISVFLCVEALSYLSGPKQQRTESRSSSALIMLYKDKKSVNHEYKVPYQGPEPEHEKYLPIHDGRRI